jgi:hypothetical protein
VALFVAERVRSNVRELEGEHAAANAITPELTQRSRAAFRVLPS